MHVTHIECLPYGGNQGGTTEQMLRPFADGAFFSRYTRKGIFSYPITMENCKAEFSFIKKRRET